jgi:membrane protease YdiL (CAAX protease family)
MARKKKAQLRREPQAAALSATQPIEKSAPALGILRLIGGVASLIAGVAILLRPCVMTRAELEAISEAGKYSPLLGVLLIAAGAAFLIFEVRASGTVEPEFALDHEFATWGERIRLLLPWVFASWLVRSWRELDREAAIERQEALEKKPGRYDYAPLVVLASGSVFLVLMEYFGHGPTLRELIDTFDPPGERTRPAEHFWEAVRDSPFLHLNDFVWWSGWRVLGFFVLPALVVRLILRRPIGSFGLQTVGFLKHAWIYVLFFALVLATVIAVSYDAHFKDYYPFYENSSRSWYDFLTWEVLYAAQFFSLEFFFRGFWLRACKTSLGSHAIFAMVVPYCMIHIGKPFLETLAAILAGVVLGTLAMRTRSIWSGFLIHVSVAVSMDMAAMLQKGGLPDRWWPVF